MCRCGERVCVLCFDECGEEGRKAKWSLKDEPGLESRRKPAADAGNDENAGPKAEGKSGNVELRASRKATMPAAAGPSASTSAAAPPTAGAAAVAPKARPALKRSAQEAEEEWKVMALLGRLPPNELAAGPGRKQPKLS